MNVIILSEAKNDIEPGSGNIPTDTHMRCLAFDTTTDISSVAITDGAEILGEYNFLHRMDLSQRLMPNVVNLLKDCKLTMADIEAVGVSLGPGSFTGLRIGVVTAKTLAQTLNIPIAGIITLDLLAHQFDYLPGMLVCPLIKVRRGEVYYALYRTGGGSIERLTGYEAGPIDDAVKLVQADHSGTPLPASGEGLGEGFGLQSAVCSPQSDQILFCGDALEANLPALHEALGDRVVAAPEWFSYPRASVIGKLAVEKIEAGEVSDPFSLVPFYIRRSAPEMRMGDSCE
jgi:tRNA threonylcarbamoyladenosine biosynthesis protein TsaB